MVLRFQEQLGAAIRRRRLELGLSQKDIAEAAHIKESQTVSRWERGLNMPSDLEAVARALKMTVPELMAGIPRSARTAHKLHIAPPEPDPSQLDRIESELSRQSALLEALQEAVEEGASVRAQTAAKTAQRRARDTPRKADRRRQA